MNPHLHRKLTTAAIATMLASVMAVAPAFAAGVRSPKAAAAKAAITRVRVRGTKISVNGKVRLPHNTASDRLLARVFLTLTDSAGATERQTAGLSAKRTYRVSWTTTFSGRVKLSAKLTIAGQQVGKRTTKAFTITAASSTPPAGGTDLVGVFKLTAGNAPAGQAPTGSYFEMLQPGGSPLENLSSPAANKDYTPLSPGSDGGLSTEAYQTAASGQLGTRIIQPVPFYGIDFSVETASTDAQTGLHDPIPVIDDDNGRLSGQLTAWLAQWNGQSFNQGTPKPNGTVPAPTTPVSGTYDSATHAFTLQWKSLIVGGPFNGFTGFWQLTGTFAPEQSSSGGLLPVVPPV